jgi:HK97 family phage portal protein
MVPAGATAISPRGGWWPIIREPFTGAWQTNQEITVPSALAYPAVFSCTTLIASDCGKLPVDLAEQDAAGIWHRTSSAAFSPVLRRPNRYQTMQKFVEQWMVSKLTQGNAYALKQRDQRGVVVALYVLDSSQVKPLVAPDGAVYYQLGASELAGIAPEATGVAVPASEMIHDPMVCLFHPLIGISPIFACGLAALQGLKIQDNSTNFFASGSNPGGVLTAPGSITDDTAKRLKEYWDTAYSGANVGKVAVLGDGLKYEAMSVNATDAQLIDQLKWTVETVCGCFHVPPSLVNGAPVPYANNDPLTQQYYSQCLQSLIVAFEHAMDYGLGLTQVTDRTLGVAVDIDDLLWMDVKTKTDAAQQGVAGGVLSPDEARAKYFGIGSVKGGNTPYMQQQMFSLAALAERDADAPFSKPAPPAPAESPEDDEDDVDLGAFTKRLTAGLLYG